MSRYRALARRRRHRNDVASAVVGGTVSAVLPVAILAGGGFAVYYLYGTQIAAYLKGLFPENFFKTPVEPAGSNDTSVQHSLGALVSHPAEQAKVLSEDVSNIASGVGSIAHDYAAKAEGALASVESGISSLWSKL